MRKLFKDGAIMRKIMIGILIIVFLIAGCTPLKESGQISADEGISETEEEKSEQVTERSTTAAVNSKEEQTAEPSTTAAVDSPNEQEIETEIGKKIKPLVSKKIDTSKQGVRMSASMELHTEMMRGDDGSCYYYRNEGKGKNKKIVFYKNNGIKVCETKMKKSFKKGKYYIVSFAKYEKKFFILLEQTYGYKSILTTVDIASGKWGKTIKKDVNILSNYIIYDNKFYDVDQGSAVTVYDLSDTKKKRKELSIGGIVQCIVDDKIYYVGGEDTTQIMRCNLDGKKKEKLYEYGRDGWVMMGSLKIDENYIYYLVDIEDHEKYNLVRIPLYGGKIEGVAKAGGYFEIADECIFFFGYNEGDDYVYRVEKNLKGEPKAVTRTYYYQYEIYSVRSAPFYFGGDHLLVQDYDKKERKYVDLMNEYDDSWDIYIDAITIYAPDWYWVSENGEIEDTIEGTGVKKRWKKEYKKWN